MDAKSFHSNRKLLAITWEGSNRVFANRRVNLEARTVDREWQEYRKHGRLLRYEREKVKSKGVSDVIALIMNSCDSNFKFELTIVIARVSSAPSITCVKTLLFHEMCRQLSQMDLWPSRFEETGKRMNSN
ncbi:hypothetical protein FNV43_RR16833 [Rhamnella rubrinervis]|uniref:Uncharacterized protein n=1 Tax=Rhamnella rubrinervis TaxID=2594499 RepID=A0A8K0GZK6_9ROSA|nr:hypothetical protein FNV43_RR16833 [Rhamnella rubrinervis]